jgi:hypothetical protein
MRPWIRSVLCRCRRFSGDCKRLNGSRCGNARWGNLSEFPAGNVQFSVRLASAYRALFTVTGGFTTAWLAPDRTMRDVWILAAIGLLAGLAGVIAYHAIGEAHSVAPGTRSRFPPKPFLASG